MAKDDKKVDKKVEKVPVIPKFNAKVPCRKIVAKGEADYFVQDGYKFATDGKCLGKV